MKTLLISGAILLSCNQQVYDAIYYGIMEQAIHSKITRNALMTRYNTVQTLRTLCNGQLSTWEKINTSPGFYERRVK